MHAQGIRPPGILLCLAARAQGKHTLTIEAPDPPALRIVPPEQRN